MGVKFMNGLKSSGLRTALSYLDANPAKNMDKLLNWGLKFDKKGNYTKEIHGIQAALADPDNNWNILVQHLWNHLDKGQRKKFSRIFS